MIWIILGIFLVGFFLTSYVRCKMIEKGFIAHEDLRNWSGCEKRIPHFWVCFLWPISCVVLVGAVIGELITYGIGAFSQAEDIALQKQQGTYQPPKKATKEKKDSYPIPHGEVE